MKGGLGNLMQQAQKMQEQMQRAQEELANLEVEGQSGGGMVKIIMTCRNEVRGVRIDNSLIGEDKDMLEDMIAAALNDALSKVEQASKEKMSGLAGGLNLPPGMKLPF
ncbi:MAG: YbaB/EbfC family nucleoid-associated protein [Gammaproteobacteria bacterium]|nr:YbaB/EbfC family nucleoid-associated protein [Gammaproteobacteria bacterium]